MRNKDKILASYEAMIIDLTNNWRSVPNVKRELEKAIENEEYEVAEGINKALDDYKRNKLKK